MKADLALPNAIELRDQWPESVCYILPRRKLGHGKWLGLLLLVVGGGIMAVIVSSLVSSLAGWPRVRVGTFVIPVLFLGFFTWGGLTPFWWGLALLLGHRELELRDGYLRTVERVGPLWRSKRWPIGQIRALEVKPVSSQETAAKHDPLDAFCALVLQTTAGKQGMLAWGYDKVFLYDFAMVLAGRAEAAQQQQSLETGGGGSTQKIEVLAPANLRRDTQEESGASANDVEDEMDPEEAEVALTETITPPPFGSPIEFEQHEGGDLTVRVPAAGIVKGSHGLFFFSVIWCGFIAFVDVVAIGGAWQQGKVDNIGVLLGFSALFWAVGIGMLLTAINMGRREAAIVLVGDSLMAMQTSLLGSQRREWQLTEIAQIKVAPSGLEVNNRKVPQLQIHDRGGDIFRILTGRTDAELHWLAATLRQSLRSAQSGGSAPV